MQISHNTVVFQIYHVESTLIELMYLNESNQSELYLVMVYFLLSKMNIGSDNPYYFKSAFRLSMNQHFLPFHNQCISIQPI